MSYTEKDNKILLVYDTDILSSGSIIYEYSFNTRNEQDIEKEFRRIMKNVEKGKYSNDPNNDYQKECYWQYWYHGDFGHIVDIADNDDTDDIWVYALFFATKPLKQ